MQRKRLGPVVTVARPLKLGKSCARSAVALGALSRTCECLNSNDFHPCAYQNALILQQTNIIISLIALNLIKVI